MVGLWFQKNARVRHARSGAVVRLLPKGIGSDAEDDLLIKVRQLNLPEPELQAKLIPGRRFRYDAVWQDQKVAVEVQGSVYSAGGGKACVLCGEKPSGRHTRGSGYESDAVKSALAQLRGYLVLYVTPGMIKSGLAGNLITEALKSRGWCEEAR